MSIRLRRTQKSDLDFVLNTEHAHENRSFINVWTDGQHRQALSNKDMAHLIIENCADDQPIGYIILAGLEQPNQSIEFRRIVVVDKGKGYGREALRLVEKMAFEGLRARRPWLDVKEYNLRAKRLYVSEGFIVEGTLRQCLKAGDKFKSLVVMSMLRSEYQK